MLRYIIRLDDATPKMNKSGWEKMEKILDKYNVKPIVGIIPDSKDPLFIWNEDKDFWTTTVQKWKNKGWVFAQHGLHHVYHDCINKPHSEFSDLSYEDQMKLIQNGHNILDKHGINPQCFFAPAHNFDDITVKVCKDSGYFKFISDGFALFPYKEQGMLFFPSIFDTPHKFFPFGVYTFVFHPSFTTDSQFKQLDEFLNKHKNQFIPVEKIILEIDENRKRNCFEMSIEPTISFLRRIRKRLKLRG